MVLDTNRYCTYLIGTVSSLLPIPVTIAASDGVYVRRTTITDLAERLDPEKFLRINRSEIVRLDAVRELQPWFHGDYRVVLTEVWSRRYRARQSIL